MSSAFNKNSKLNFATAEKKEKKNIDFFNLKEQRAQEEKKEKFSNFCFVCLATVFIVVFVAVIYA